MGVIIKPVITEKMSAQSEKLNKYAFLVAVDANKVEIKKAVEKMYGVTVKDVNTANYLGKSKSRFTKTGVVSGSTPNFKKATVTVAPNETIDFYSNI